MSSMVLRGLTGESEQKHDPYPNLPLLATGAIRGRSLARTALCDC